eukprot:scaffold57774_cov33-Cyclotella_meneghiniana.AAC.1
MTMGLSGLHIFQLKLLQTDCVMPLKNFFSSMKYQCQDQHYPIVMEAICGVVLFIHTNNT